ncbi:hypothetical protein NL676_024817 [Syzygium grande]|nr:hypothetical protein NL676_024817 [Syzygium grande]
MDTLGASAYEEWDSLSLFAFTEELIDITPYVLGQYPISQEHYNLQTVSQESSSITGESHGYVVSTCQGIGSNNHTLVANDISPCFDVFSYAFKTDVSNNNSFVSELSGTLMEEGAYLKEMHSERRGSLGHNQPEDVSVPLMQLLSLRKKIKGPRNAKKLLSDDFDGDESDVRPNGSSTCSSEDSDSRKLNGELTPPFKASTTLAENGNMGKVKAARGSATDPQSLYARVDISTMLEEAVHYVKFLQLQIKFLSSDELWMYTPLAYNGMDLNLSQIIFPQL